MFALLAAINIANAADKYWSGSGIWTTGGAGQWSATSGSGYGTATWSDGDNAIFEGAVGTVTLGGDITISNLTFATTSEGYVINGYTLNFEPGATIDQTGSNINHTIATAITGSPDVRIIDNQGANYDGIIFAPTNGTVTLGDCTVPYNVGPGDKGGIELNGTTTGNSVASVTFEGGDHYADVRKAGPGTWSIGNVLIGTVRINDGTLVANGTIDTRYQNIQVNSGGTLAYNNPGAALTTLQFSGGSLDNTSGAPITNSTHIFRVPKYSPSLKDQVRWI